MGHARRRRRARGGRPDPRAATRASTSAAAHPDRFQPHHAAPAYVRARGAQQYAEVYDVLHPAQPLEHPRGLRTLPYHERLVELGGRFVESAGWERAAVVRRQRGAARAGAPPAPRRLGGPMFWSELVRSASTTRRAPRPACSTSRRSRSSRSRAADADGLAEPRLRLRAGPPRRPHRLHDGADRRPAASVCDLTVTRLAEDRFLVVTGGGSGPRDVAWLRGLLPEGGGVRLRDVTSAQAVLGLWGPRARDVLAPLAGTTSRADAFPYMAARQLWLEHVPALALRISYAGELGWELYVPTEYGRWTWDRLIEAGAPHGLAPCGLGAFESLRIEKGYRFAGVDMYREHTPDEAGLGFTVHLDKPSLRRARGACSPRASAARASAWCRSCSTTPNAQPLGGEPMRVDGSARRPRDERGLRPERRRVDRLRLAAAGAAERGAARGGADARPLGRRRRRQRAALGPARRAPARLTARDPWPSRHCIPRPSPSSRGVPSGAWRTAERAPRTGIDLPPRRRPTYGRDGNPGWAAFEAALGELEGGTCVAFASGLAASSAILDELASGARVVAQRAPYFGVAEQLRDRDARGQLTLVALPEMTPAALEATVEGAGLVWVESPTNPMLDVVDLGAVIAIARAAGALVVVDNTFATPFGQTPLAVGADVVLHSATKLIGGHSDLLLGRP